MVTVNFEKSLTILVAPQISSALEGSPAGDVAPLPEISLSLKNSLGQASNF